jgi:mannosyltransferase OCH1-like enzyme
MIPRLIHQTARTADLPPREQKYVAILRDLHPGWTYKLWTDQDNLAFVKSEFADFLDIFTGLPKNIMRADVIRYLLMYKLGGLYLDTDYEMLKPFDYTDHECVLPLENADELLPDGRIANSLFASAPGHPFFKAVIDELRAHPPLGANSDVLTSTGPHFISRVLHQTNRDGLNITLPRKELFNPPTPRNAREHRAIIDKGAAYAIHHCHGSWREYSLGENIKTRLSRLVHRFT